MPDARSTARWGGENPGLRKAAVLLVSVDAETASKLMGQLDRAEQERVAREIVRLEERPPGPVERDGVLKEFQGLHRVQEAPGRGGVRSAQRILEKVVPAGEAKRILDGIEQSLGRTRFEFLKRMDIQNVASFLSEEQPQTVALILSYLPPSQAARLVETLPLPKQQEVVRRLASMEPTNPRIVEQVEKALETRLSAYAVQELRGINGRAVAAAVLNQVDRATERGILEGLKADEPEVAEGIRRLMFVFDDLMRVNDRGIQNLLKNVDSARLSLALKTARPELRDKFFRNMSQRAAERIREDMELMGPVRVAEVEAAQEVVVDEILRLEEAGEAVIEGRGGSEAVVL